MHSLQDARLRQKRIGKALSQVYAAMVSEEPPQAFLDLLAQADCLHSRHIRMGARGAYMRDRR
jgi:hypothetical protein